MHETILNLREIPAKDWATIIFVVVLTTIVLLKSRFENRFNDFARFLVSSKYSKVYKDTNNLMSGFTIIMFLLNMVSLSFFIQIILDNFGYVSKYDWIVFIQIFTFLLFFILSKFLIEKIVATTFNIEELIDQINLQKVNYRTYLGFLLLPIDVVLFYHDYLTKTAVFSIIIAFLLYNAINYLVLLTKYQNFIFRKLFYFILYLCALEIAPYYFMYYWFTNR